MQRNEHTRITDQLLRVWKTYVVLFITIYIMSSVFKPSYEYSILHNSRVLIVKGNTNLGNSMHNR